MKTFFYNKLYHTNVVEKSFHRVLGVSSEQSLQKKTSKNKTQPLPSVLIFSRSAQDTMRFAREKYKSILLDDVVLSKVLPPNPLAAFRRRKNLMDSFSNS